jgi:hypothetical protein
VNEPDSWLVNLANNSAKHVVDQVPTFNCRLPVFAFSPEMVKSKLGELEFGRELNFFKDNNARVVDGPKLEFITNYYELTIGDAVLRLVERADIHAPLMIGLLQNNKVTRVRYLLWDDEVPFKADVFARPSNVSIEETR